MSVKIKILFILIIISLLYVGCGNNYRDAYEQGKKVGYDQGFNVGYAKGKSDAQKELDKIPPRSSFAILKSALLYLGPLIIIGASVFLTVWVRTTKKGASRQDLQNIYETLQQMQKEMSDMRESLADLIIQKG